MGGKNFLNFPAPLLRVGERRSLPRRRKEPWCSSSAQTRRTPQAASGVRLPSWLLGQERLDLDPELRRELDPLKELASAATRAVPPTVALSGDRRPTLMSIPGRWVQPLGGVGLPTVAEPLFPRATSSPLLIVSTCRMTSTIPTMLKFFLENTALLIVRTPRPMWRRLSCTPNTTLGLSTTTSPSCACLLLSTTQLKCRPPVCQQTSPRIMSTPSPRSPVGEP